MQTRETWKRDNQFLHPYVNFLVEGMREIRSLIAANRYTAALDYIFWLIPFLDPEIKNRLDKNGNHVLDVLEGKQVFTKDLLYETLDTVMTELHKAGYFAGAKVKEILIGYESGVKPPIEPPEAES